MPRARASTREGRKHPSMRQARKASPGKTRYKYLPKAAYLILRGNCGTASTSDEMSDDSHVDFDADFHMKVTPYPNKEQKKELASMIAKVPGARACTAAKITAYFKERRKTVARAAACKSASEAVNVKIPVSPLRIRIPPSKQLGAACDPPCPTEARTDDLASRLQDALSEVSIALMSPPKTFAELGALWCQETDTFSKALLSDIAAGVYRSIGL
ncbi:hypothetical protein C8T65DRAFT_651051 [Cerioporus squamosus]|nr:hypothetical protein C8T65DRAFT_651051 [Cerioporus squamosus]